MRETLLHPSVKLIELPKDLIEGKLEREIHGAWTEN
jgi:hypothetical protein